MGAGKITEWWRRRRARLGIDAEDLGSSSGSRPLIAVVHQNAEHVEGIILVPVRQRVRRVMGKELALGDRHPGMPELLCGLSHFPSMRL